METGSDDGRLCYHNRCYVKIMQEHSADFLRIIDSTNNKLIQDIASQEEPNQPIRSSLWNNVDVLPGVLKVGSTMDRLKQMKLCDCSLIQHDTHPTQIKQ